MKARITIPEIAQRLSIGRMAVYSMLEQGIIPGIRLGKRWIVTRHAYEQWERTAGMRSGAGFNAESEVRVN
ncbi:MAG: excisionase family DNA-binding protein [Bryobacterales bacterium]|nr:excisionase family DNA-binding protein [Bryobacterales bacterium]